MAKVVYDFYMTQAACALEIPCDSHERKSYRLNRPLENNNVWLNGVKRLCSGAVIGGFRSTLSVSVSLWSTGCCCNYN